MRDNLDRILQSFERKAEERARRIFRDVQIGKDSVLFLISPMAYCNFSCIYCSSYGYNTRVNPRKNLPPDKIYKFVRMVIDFKQRHPHSVLTLVFHGYEPLQYDFRVYKRVDQMVYESGFHKLNNPSVPPIALGVQTNGYLVTESRIRFFHERQWSVSFSLDGPKEVHDYARRTRWGAPTYDRVMQGIKLYEKYFGEKPFIISVWTKKHLEIGPEGYYEWLRENEFRKADIHYPSIMPGNPNESKFAAPMRDIIRWFLELYEIWKNDNSGIILYPFVSYIEALVMGRGQGRACFLRNGCFRVIELSYDGKFHFCDRWSFNLDISIDEIQRIEDIYKSRAFVKLAMRPFVLRNYHTQCSNCKWFPVCLGGCPAEAKYTSSVYRNALFGEPTWNNTNYCPFHRAMFERIAKDLKERGVELGIKV